MYCPTFRWSHGLNLVNQHIPAYAYGTVPPPSSSPLLLPNCQAAPGPAQHLRHWLLILLDHRKKHVCLWNVRASPDYASAERVFASFPCLHSRESRWEGSASILLLLTPCSPSGFDSGVRLCFLLALCFMVVMIYCVGVPGGIFELLSFVSCFPPLLFLCVSIDKHFSCCHSLRYYWRRAPCTD